ncbi:MAG: gatA, partial [Labilithrix sp.]|nr:gatA [Labilithrix sp.]
MSPPGGMTDAREAIRAAKRRESSAEGLNAFLSFADEDALTVENPSGPLAGVPIAVKDVLATLDLPTTCGSRVLEG